MQLILSLLHINLALLQSASINYNAILAQQTTSSKLQSQTTTIKTIKGLEKWSFREYVSGSNGYKADGATRAMSSYAPNCTALAVRRRHKLPKDVYFVTGVIFTNTRGGTINGQVVGEGAGVSQVKYYGNVKIGSQLYPLSTGLGGLGQRELILPPNGVQRMYLSSPVPVEPEDVIWLQFTVETDAATDRVCSFHFLDYTEPEIQVSYNNLLPTDNSIAARLQVDDPNWSPPTISRNALFAPTAAPSVAAVTVLGDGPCIAGFGTSREIGRLNSNFNPTLVNDGYWQRICESKGIAYIDFTKGAARGFQDLSPSNTVVRKQCMIGVTHVLNGHNQNDLHVQTLSQLQATMKSWKQYCESIDALVMIITCHAWNQAASSTGNTLDNYATAWPFPVADASVEVERQAWNAYLRNGGLLIGGDGVTLATELGDIFLDVAAAIDDPIVSTNFVDPRSLVMFGSIDSATMASFVDIDSGVPPFSTFDMTVLSFTASNAPTIAQLRGNTPSGQFVLDRSSAGLGMWSNGIPAAGSLWVIFPTLCTADGIHANEYGRRRQSQVFKVWADTLVP